MTFDDDMQRRFDEAQHGLTLEPGSIESVRARGEQRGRNRRLASSVAVIVLLLGLGGVAVLNRPGDDMQEIASVASDPAEQDGPAEDADPAEQDGTAEDADPAEQDGTAEDADPVERAGGAEGERLDEDDLTYLGAFVVPIDEVNGSSFEFGGEVSAFNPFGDPSSDDGFDGSLFLSGHPRRQPGIAEVAIPPPALHDGTPDELPVAEFVAPFADITGGRGMAEVGSRDVGGQDEFRYGGLEVVDGADGPRLHWSIWQYNNVGPHNVPGHGHSSLDLDAPDPQGPWFLGDHDNRLTAGYLFSVPDSFAEDTLGGRSLIAGFKARAATFGRSWGPPFFAYEPPGEATIGERLDDQQLAVFPDAGRALTGFGRADTAGGAAWITADDGANAVMTVGLRGLGEVIQGEPRDQDCGIDTSVHAGPYEPLVMFFDPADIARAAAGEIEPWDLAPYRTWNPSEHLIATCEWRLSSISVDAIAGRIYVVQMDADFSQSEFASAPVVHVFQL